MANSIFLCSLNGWMILYNIKKDPLNLDFSGFSRIRSLPSQVWAIFFWTKKTFESWRYKDTQMRTGNLLGNELVQMWRWFLKIDWKQLVQIAIQLRSWLYLGICCAPSTLRSNLGIPAFMNFWNRTSWWCPFSCVSNRHQLVPSDPAPKTHAHLVAGQTPILKTFNVKPTSKISTQKRMKLSTSHFIGCTFDTGWVGWFFTEDSMDSQCPLKVLGCHSGKDGATMAEASWCGTKTEVFGCFFFQRLILHLGKFQMWFQKREVWEDDVCFFFFFQLDEV